VGRHHLRHHHGRRHRRGRLAHHPHHVAAETTAAAILYGTATLGVPVSTTHVISTSIMGVGATKRLSAVKWGVVQRILWAWVLTIPVTALLGYLLERLFLRF